MPSSTYPLTGVRIVDLTTGIAGPYCTKLFVDAGAEVLKVEPPSGDPARAWTAGDATTTADGFGPLYAFLNASKHSVVADLDNDEDLAFVRALCAGADLVVEDFEPGVIERLGLGIDDLHAQNPATSLLSISHFGRGGPWSNRPANEFTLQGQVGGIDYRGLPGQEPFAAGGSLGDYTVGAFAAPAALAALHLTRHSGRGVHLDVSQFEAMMLSFQVFRQIFSTFDPGKPLGRSMEIPSIEPAADGYVGFCTITSQQYTDFCHLIGAPELAAPHMMFADARMANRDEMWQKIRTFTEQHTVEDIVASAAAMRIPVSPVGDGRVVLSVDHFVGRGVFIENPAGFQQPRPPYQLSGIELRPPGSTAPLGSDTQRVRREAGTSGAGRTRIATAPDAAPTRNAPWLPLAGVKVADFSAFWAGPIVTEMLSALGADVIKIESIQRPDGMRFSAGMTKPQVWEWSPVSQSVNVGKRAITLDLGQDDGRALAQRLVNWADIVVENFSPRVMEHFGFGWDSIHEANARAIMLRMPAFGLDGPWRDRTGFAMTIEQASGLAWVTGHADGPPMVPRGVCDPFGGMHAVFALLLALRERERLGVGCLIELPLIEVGLNAAAEQIVEWSANGKLLERIGNKSRHRAPQGVYESSEPDVWVAVSVDHPEQWSALCAVIGAADLAADPTLATVEGRQVAHVRIDAAIGAFVARHNAELAAELLLAAGVPAAPCINAIRTATSIHHDVRQFHQWMQHPVAGWVPYPSFPFTVDGSFCAFARPAPTLGQHNREVFREVLGLDDTTLAALTEAKVIGDWPVWIARPTAAQD
jgi:crotonobetainyl-CoA:carnitine CoA-transferase CaiB-like acyl-CoA transferase